MENMDYYNKFRTVPQEAQKPISGGRLKGMTDINPMWRIKALTEAFGPVGIGWYYKVISKHVETVGSESAAFVDIELYYKHEGEWSMPIFGTGGSSFVTKERSGNLYMSDECYKMALTDAISIAFKALGGAGDIYFSKDRTKYDVQSEVSEGKAQDNKVTVEMLREIIKKLGKTEEEYIEWYNNKIDTKTISDIKYMKQESKQHLYNVLSKKVGK